MRLDFYSLNKWSLEIALAKILKKVCSLNKRALVLASSEERVESLCETLWSQEPDSWFGHGSSKDGDSNLQLIWITHIFENPNNAEFVILTDSRVSNEIYSFERCIDIFDSKDEDVIQLARDRWEEANNLGHELHYWKQANDGSWIEGNIFNH